jgi:phosphopantetheinyl transferase (holo-ACP synthase)
MLTTDVTETGVSSIEMRHLAARFAAKDSTVKALRIDAETKGAER